MDWDLRCRECSFSPRPSRMYLVDLGINSTVISSVFLHCLRITILLNYLSFKWSPEQRATQWKLSYTFFVHVFLYFQAVLNQTSREQFRCLNADVLWRVRCTNVSNILAGLADYIQIRDWYPLELLFRAEQDTLGHMKCH